MNKEEINMLLESLRNALIKRLSPNYFYSRRIVSRINEIIDFYKYDERAKEKTMKKCALMDCELKGDELTLGELLRKIPIDSQGYNQIKALIKQGFKKEDILCEDCFWK